MAIDVSTGLSEALQRLDMDGGHSAGLKWVEDKESEKDPYVYLMLEQAQSFEAIAVYFRFFADGRPPRPQVFVYAFAELSAAQNKGPEIHHHLWNAGIVPYCFIYGVSQILVYNCNNSPEIDPDGKQFITKPDDLIVLLGKVREELFARYSARQFDSGLFWDSENAKKIKYEQSAYEQLLTQLKNVKKFIIAQAGKGNSGLVKRILMMLILIKYLEERKDENGKGALEPAEFYAEFAPEKPSLIGVLKSADRILAVLNKLSSREHFNGQIFLLDAEEQQKLKAIDLNLFRYFVEGETAFSAPNKSSIGQMSFWRLYSFSYLPIELISHIYEDFLTDEDGQKKTGVVYTPPYLVQFLVDRCMPLNHPKEIFKILDPACGSGIFLVGAFKRMIQWWRVRNNWKKPQKENINELKALLLANIYGCEFEEEAVRLSYFSVSLALLDALSPREIWKNVHFDNLMGSNLFSGDFFQTLSNEQLPKDFDLVIGNPPFQSEFTYPAMIVDANEKIIHPERPGIPDNQIALLFLEQSLNLLREGGKCCLILSSGPLLYNTNVHDFKRYLFNNHFFREIYDFTPLRAKLFKSSSASAKPAALAVFAENNLSENKFIHHLLFRRTKASGEKIEFEIDHYDIHRVPYQIALDVPKVWQANFMGGGRLHQLAKRMASAPTLKDYLDEKAQNNGWKYAEGWIESPDAKPLKRIQFLEGKSNLIEDEQQELNTLQAKYKADWITGHLYVETESLSENSTIKTFQCDIKYFYRSAKKNKQIFEPPHILLKENVGGRIIPTLFSNDYLTFKDKIIGIHSPKEDLHNLKKLEKQLEYEYNVALIWLLSGQVLTSREGVPLKGDILLLPHPDIKLEIDSIEQIFLDDILDYYSEFRTEGEKSKILNTTDPEDLEAFGEYYCRVLNSIYKNFKPIKPIVSKDFIAYPFVLGDIPEIEIPNSIEKIEKKLISLIDNQIGNNLWIRRIVKVYDKNVIFLYKPNQKRYWLRSIAIRDADETFMDLFKQGK